MPVERLRSPTPEEALLYRRSSAAWRAYECLRDGSGCLEALPGTIQEAIEIEAWIERKSPNGAVWRLGSFREWVTTASPVGLGTTYERLCDLLARDDAALAAVRKAWGTEVAAHGGARADVEQACITSLPFGTADYTRARLARDADPAKSKLPAEEQERARALVTLVDQGVIRPNKAAVEMGYRKPTPPLRAVQRAWDQATAEEKDKIAEWIDAQRSPLRGSRIQ